MVLIYPKTAELDRPLPRFDFSPGLTYGRRSRWPTQEGRAQATAVLL